MGEIMKIILSALFMALLILCDSFAENQPNLPSMLEEARNGDIEAMCDLGITYFYGKGTLKDPFKAKCWIKKAYDNGSHRAEKIWNDLELWTYSGKCEASFDDAKLPRYGRGDVYREPVTGIKFVFIPNGCFLMGCHPVAEKCGKDEMPVHRVCLDGFWMGTVEVTQQQWRRIIGSNPSRFSGNSDRPVENVSFDDILEFIQILNAKTIEAVSLPTEAQWEYACRNGGKAVNFSWGNESYRPDENCGTCNSGDFHGETAPVGSFPPNEIGLYDMAGNVKEWCRDIYDKNAYAGHAKKNPLNEGKGSSRVVRGGSFTDNTSKLRCTGRDKSIPGMRSDNLGFRLVLERKN